MGMYKYFCNKCGEEKKKTKGLFVSVAENLNLMEE